MRVCPVYLTLPLAFCLFGVACVCWAFEVQQVSLSVLLSSITHGD